LKYRPEIDGLRAIAVISVILFHAGFEPFVGGFIGVDVFFVISGYLITTILIESIETKRFSLIGFYERRARRILPALFLVILVCIPVVFFTFNEEQGTSFYKSAIATIFFSSNFLFWSETGYFDSSALTKPLLHTWSLGVEEQFYLVFPLLLILFLKLGRKKAAMLLGLIALLSLLISERTAYAYPEANFFLLHARASELFFGALAAFVVLRRGVQSNNPISLLGLSAILFAIFVYDNSTPFPSIHALIPVWGVVLVVLFAGKDTVTAKLLSTKLPVAIGLVSYSAYLWHQPILVFLRLSNYEYNLPDILRVLAIFVTFVLAFLSWKYVEQPFRNKQKLATRKKLFVAVGSTGTLLAALASLSLVYPVYYVNKIIKTPANNYAVKEIAGDAAFDYLGLTKLSQWNEVSATLPLNPTRNCRVLIIGDSHAKQLRSGFARVLAGLKGCEVDTISFPGCPSLFGYFDLHPITQTNELSSEKACRDQTEIWKQYITDNYHKYSHVVLSSRWNWLINSSHYVNKNIHVEYVLPYLSRDISNDQRRREFSDALAYTGQYLLALNLKVVVFSQPPVQLLDLRELTNWLAYEKARPPRSGANIRQQRFDDVLERSGLKVNPNFFYAKTFNYFCPPLENTCENQSSNNSYYLDDNHLSEYGSEAMGLLLLKMFPTLFTDKMIALKAKL